MTLSTILDKLPLFVAPVMLAIFTFITAYVFKFGMPRTGINADYILFTIYILVVCLAGGVI